MRGGALQVGGTARGRQCLCQEDGVRLLFTVEGPEEGCGGRKKTSKDGSAITGLCYTATNHSCHVNRSLKRPIFLPLKNWNAPDYLAQLSPFLFFLLLPAPFLSRYRSSRFIVFLSSRPIFAPWKFDEIHTSIFFNFVPLRTLRKHDYRFDNR